MAPEKSNGPEASAGTSSNLPFGATRFPEELRASGEVLARAARRSGEEARDVLGSAGPPLDAAFPARLGDLYRAQAFLWAGAGIAAGERLGRTPVGLVSDGLAPSRRALVLGTVASELWSGYAVLRERARWFPRLVSEEDWGLQHRRGAGRVLDAAAALGGTLIKAGQFASTRPDLLPLAYTETLSGLQDRVPPQPWPVIQEAVSRELRRPTAEVFAGFDREPIAAASIAQVHRACLRDGREVAVKVQYPRIAGLIEADLSALESIFGAISRLEPSVRLRPILDYLRWTLPLELDFRHEARAIGDLRRALEHRADDVTIPDVVEGPSTYRILVMGFEKGVKVNDREGLVAAGMDPREVAELLIDVYADQLFRRGVFHADPHPGNLLARQGSEGPTLVLLDHGLTVRVEPDLVESLRGVILALEVGDYEGLFASLQKAGLELGPEADLDTLLGLVGVLLGNEREEADDGDLGGFGLKLGSSVGGIPVELLLVGRAVGLIDGIARHLYPDIDTIGIVARHVRES
ncbi:MAG TPA: AarF/UbiB family protein [Rubrobacteraceae bacterium]|nr:AarF/UbiB family protein [Rubrobacteraceae bacterium]